MLIDLTMDLRFFMSKMGRRTSHRQAERKKRSLDISGLRWEWSPGLGDRSLMAGVQLAVVNGNSVF